MAIVKVTNFDELQRSPLARMERHVLWALAKQEGIPCKEKETRDEMVMILQGAGIDPMRPPKLETDPAITGVAHDQPQPAYGSMNFYELRKLVKAKGLNWLPTDKRADLLVKLGAA